LNFALAQFHGYDIEHLEMQLPFEREIYVALLMQHIAKQKEHQANQR